MGGHIVQQHPAVGALVIGAPTQVRPVSLSTTTVTPWSPHDGVKHRGPTSLAFPGAHHSKNACREPQSGRVASTSAAPPRSCAGGRSAPTSPSAASASERRDRLIVRRNSCAPAPSPPGSCPGEHGVEVRGLTAGARGPAQRRPSSAGGTAADRIDENQRGPFTGASAAVDVRDRSKPR